MYILAEVDSRSSYATGKPVFLGAVGFYRKVLSTAAASRKVGFLHLRVIGDRHEGNRNGI